MKWGHIIVEVLALYFKLAFVLLGILRCKILYRREKAITEPTIYQTNRRLSEVYSRRRDPGIKRCLVARQGVAPGIDRGELGSEEETDYATTE